MLSASLNKTFPYFRSGEERVPVQTVLPGPAADKRYHIRGTSASRGVEEPGVRRSIRLHVSRHVRHSASLLRSQHGGPVVGNARKGIIMPLRLLQWFIGGN